MRHAVFALVLLFAWALPASSQEISPKGYIEMPTAEDSAWILTSRTGSGRNWGKPAFVRYLALVAREWLRRHPEGPRLRIGDMSKPDGSDFPPHKTHKDGLTADIFTSPQNACHVNYPNQGLTLELAQLMVDYGAKQILYNGDLVVANVPIAQKWPKHDNHFHVVIDAAKVPDAGVPLVFATGDLKKGGWIGISDVEEDLSKPKVQWRVMGKAKLKHCRVIFDDLDHEGDPLHDSGPLKTSQSEYKVPLTLQDNRSYRWKVEVVTADDDQATTGWQQLKTDFTRPKVTSLDPKDEAEQDQAPTLRWRYEKAGVGQTSYAIELDGDSNHRKIKTTLGPFKGAGSEHTLEVKSLKRVKKYFWRVVVTDAHGNEAGSEWQVFKTSRLYGKATRERSKSTKKPKPGKVQGGRYGKVSASRLNLRKGPATGSDVLTTLRMGTEVRILGDKGDWFEVEVTGKDGQPQQGYVSKRYIKE